MGMQILRTKAEGRGTNTAQTAVGAWSRRSSRRGPVQPAYAPQGAYSAPVQRYSPQEAEGCAYGMPQPGAGLGRIVSPYYAREFADIAAGGRGRFNAAAFFLGPFHQLYRGCYKRFARTYLPYWLALLAVLGVSLSFFGKLCVELAGYGGRPQSRRRRFSCGSPRSCCCPWA